MKFSVATDDKFIYCSFKVSKRDGSDRIPNKKILQNSLLGFIA